MKMSNSLDPDQAQRFVGPDLILGPNCLHGLSTDDTCRQRVKHEEFVYHKKQNLVAQDKY